MSETVPRDELAILQPRKLMERDDSGWAKTKRELQAPDAFDLNPPTDSAATPTSHPLGFESGAGVNSSASTGALNLAPTLISSKPQMRIKIRADTSYSRGLSISGGLSRRSPCF